MHDVPSISYPSCISIRFPFQRVNYTNDMRAVRIFGLAENGDELKQANRADRITDILLCTAFPEDLSVH